MTINDFYNAGEMFHCPSKIKVLSAYNGKVLCKRYDPEKHSEIGKRELRTFWADMEVSRCGFSTYAYPIICCHADGKPEYDKEHGDEVKQYGHSKTCITPEQFEAIYNDDEEE